MITIYISKQQYALLLLGLLSCLIQVGYAQELRTPTSGDLPEGGYITGLYHLQADEGSEQYVRAVDGVLEYGTLDEGDSAYYFWIVENAFDSNFQLYSASENSNGLPLTISKTGQSGFSGSNTNAASRLLLQMYPEGPLNDVGSDAAPRGEIITESLPDFGIDFCQCNILAIDGNSRFRIIPVQNETFSQYRPMIFEKIDANSPSIITIEDDTTVIFKPDAGTVSSENYVSTRFYVKNFGEDDFRVNFAPDTEGVIGFLHYTHHEFTNEVYKDAQPQMGIKIKDNNISLFYRSGAQILPNSSQVIGNEIETDFVAGQDIAFGFKDQDVLLAKQGDKTYELKGAAPADFFLNRSITQSARVLVQLTSGEMLIATTPKNSLIGSDNDFGDVPGTSFVSTDPYIPYNEGRELLNRFDWQTTQWEIRYQDNGIKEEMVFSPFYTNNLDFKGIAAQFDPNGDYRGGEDFVASEGWELIKAKVGYFADGIPVPQAPGNPYVIFYNRITGLLRIFVYTKNVSVSNQLKISMSVDPGLPGPQGGDTYIPKLWGSLQQFEALDTSVSSEYSRAVPMISSQQRVWYFADFVMEYDPCIQFFESSIRLSISKTTRGDLSLIGRLEGGAVPAGTEAYDDWQNNKDNFLLGVMDNDFGALENTLGDITFNQYENFDAKEFTEEVTGTLVGKEIEEWEKEAARIQWEATGAIADSEIRAGRAKITEGSFQILEGTAKIAGGSFSLIGEAVTAGIEGTAKIAQGSAKIVAGKASVSKGEARNRIAYVKKLQFDAIKDKTKRGDQEINLPVPPPRPQAVFGELALKGTLTIETEIIPEEFIATPGGKNSDEAPEIFGLGTRGSAPLYNKPMGRFALLKAPEFGIGVIKDNNLGYVAHLKIREKPYFIHNSAVLGKIDDVFKISFYVETYTNGGKLVEGRMSPGFTNLFGQDDNNPLQGEFDITGYVNWDQIENNIRSANYTPEEIQEKLGDWIKVSYEVWSLSLSTIKSRNLDRVFANGDNYYNGKSEFSYSEEDVSSLYDLQLKVRDFTAVAFDEYTFSDHPDWGTQYNLYNTQSDFEELMQAFCENLNGGNITNKSVEKIISPFIEQPMIVEDLVIAPNPATVTTNFQLSTAERGTVQIALLNLGGQELLVTENSLYGSNRLTGKLAIGALHPGVYLLKVILPSGKTITKKIVKN